MRRPSALLSAALVAALALAPSLADARAGGGGSFGSRGGRSFSAPPVTNTAPFAASPLDRSLTPRPQAPGYTPGYAGTPMGAPARSGFGSGLLGGLLGVGIGSMLFGGGFMGNGSGFGFIGLLLQLVLLFFVGRWILRRVLGQRMAFAGMPRMGQPVAQGAAYAAPGGIGARPAPTVNIGPADYAAYDQLLQSVQAAWTAHDIRALSQLTTPEMASYFGEQLAEQTSRGWTNSVTDVRLEKGDLSEAWAENGREYATVAMRFSMLDVTRDQSGRVVDGDAATRNIATELWTFIRAPGGRWLLSAIQQAR